MSIMDTDFMRGVVLFNRTHDVDLAIETLRSQRRAKERVRQSKQKRHKEMLQSLWKLRTDPVFIGCCLMLMMSVCCSFYLIWRLFL